MTNINELTAKLKAAALEEIMCRESCDTSDLWQDEVGPGAVLALTEALEAAEKRISDYDTALCSLLPDCRYMDPPDGGSVTPLEQVARMVEDYCEQLEVVSKSEWKLAGALTEAQMNNTVLEKRLKDAEKIINEQDQRLLDYAAIATKNAEKVAELEARTLTVTYPDVMPPEAAPAHYWGEGESMAYADGYNKSTSDLKASIALACAADGVNVEFE